MPQLVKWSIAPILSLALGVLLVNFLTVHPTRMNGFLFGTTLVLWVLVALVAIWFRGVELAMAIPLSLALFVAGYLLMAGIVLAREGEEILPELTRAQGDPGLGHTAVVYFTHGEPETYTPQSWINQFREFDEQKIPFVPFVARPLFLSELRRHYLLVGRSNHRFMHTQMIRALEREYRLEGDTTTRFYLSFLDDAPRPNAATIQALNEGASRIVVSEVFLTISNHTAEGKEQIEALGVEAYVPIHYTGPLYDSNLLKRMFLERANAHIGDTPKDRVGVLLVGHGQPDEWDQEWPTETAQEIGFREEVLDLFAQDGYRRENLSLAWMEFKAPKPAAKVEEFARNGVEKVIYFAAAISGDAIHSQYDIPAMVQKARVPESLPLINLGAWNDDPLVIQAIKEKIDAQMKARVQAP